MADVSVSKAARMAGKGRSTIQRHIKEGKLSASKDASGNPVIDVSELARVYGSIKADKADKSDMVRQADTAELNHTAQVVIETLRAELQAAREREVWLKGQLEAEQERSQEFMRRMLPAGDEKKGFFRRLVGG